MRSDDPGITSRKRTFIRRHGAGLTPFISKCDVILTNTCGEEMKGHLGHIQHLELNISLIPEALYHSRLGAALSNTSKF
jgi:hypothetical protein